MNRLVTCLLSGVFAASQVVGAGQSNQSVEKSISGPFPILSAPYEEDGSLDLETLVREARYVASTGVNGFIWAQSNDAVDLLTIDEKKASFTALVKAFAGSPTYVTLGCQGRDTADMETLARHVEELAAAHPTTRILIACRPPLNARSQDDLERYYRRLAKIAHRPVIIQTYAADDVPNPSSELLIRLARERPDIFGWIKEETGEADADVRMQVECAAPEVKTVFSAWGSWGWVRQHRTFGTRGVISERAAYAAELLEVWRALLAKDDARADAIWAKYTDMLRLKKILPGGEHRNFSLHVLNRLGVFKNMVSREYADEKKTPGKWKLSTRTFTRSEIAEIERRWAALRAAAGLPPVPQAMGPRGLKGADEAKVEGEVEQGKKDSTVGLGPSTSPILTASPSAAGLPPVPQANSRSNLDVVVIYYPHWHAYPKGDEWFHKGFNEWEFCRTARKLFPDHRVPIEPLFGYIDESKPENVEKEIALAADAGITVFMYDWYWYDGQMTMQEALEQGFLKAKNRDRLKFCLMWCYHDRADPFRADPSKPTRMLMPLARTEEEFLGCIRYATERFFREPNHWMRDGRPFFSIYNAPAFVKDRGGAAGARQALERARAIARAAGFKGICFQAMGPRGLRGAEELVAAGFDVLGDYGLSQGLVPEARRACKDGSIFYDYASTCPPAHQKRWNEIRSAAVPYIPGVSAGRDASPRCRLDEPFPWKKIAYPYDGIATNNTPEAFGRILEMAKETVLADPKKPGAVLIYGWNEYTEGGYIAPTRLNGDGHLKAVSRVFGAGEEGKAKIEGEGEGWNNSTVRLGTSSSPKLGLDVVEKTVLADWEFQRDGSGPFVPVRVPHDWAIAGEFDPDATRYPDAKLFCGYAFTGKLPWRGTGLYRRRFRLTERQRDMLQRGGRVLFEFDGVMANPEVRLNGVRLGGWDYGYMGFAVDATDALNRAGENVIEVFATTKWHGARWHPGGGIYREARMVTSWANRVKPGTLKITTTNLSNFSNLSNFPIEVCISYEQLSGAPATRTLTIEKPRLWSVDDPFLYSVDIAGEEFRYGVRTIAWTADDGFHLNGRRLQIRGVNLHADLGPLGMAFDVDAARRQLAIMKDMGVNAIRTSHNPPAPQFLDLCDEMGFVVWDECFDKWNDLSGKRPDQNLEEYVTRNLEQFVRRDRNHPCVVAWSVGNEIKPASADYPEGMTKARCAAFRAAIRRLDSTRPVAAGSDSLALLETGALEPLDLQGWNYARRYAAAHAKYPNVPVVASETASALSSGGYYSTPPSPGRVAYAIAAREVDSYDHNSAIWSDIPDWEFERLEQDRYCAGEFVWTGIDYIGEPTPYAKRGILHFDWLKAIPERELARSSYFGTVDLCGIPKDRFYLYRSYWRPEQPTVHVLPHWNWSGHEGRNVPVYVYSNGDEAELFLNGRSLGRRRKATGTFAADFREGRLDSDDFRTNGYYAVCDKYRFRWLDVAYEPGELKAVCYREGRRIGEGIVRTAGPAAGLRLVRDPYSAADARTVFVRVEAVDATGVVCPLSTDRVSFAAFGDGELVAVGNGDARDYDSFGQTGSHWLYFGRAVMVVRRRGFSSDGASPSDFRGRMVLKATADRLGSVELVL